MTKNAALKTTDNDGVRQAKRAFVFGLLDLSWKLGVAFLLPTLIGVAIDSGSPDPASRTYTVFGVMTGFILATLVIIQLSRQADDLTTKTSQTAPRGPRRHK